MFPNGDWYEGDWLTNKRHGRGIFFIKKENTTIDGTFRFDILIQGKLGDSVGNIFLTVDDDSQPGKFENGKLNGRIKVEYANGNLYNGMFVEGKRSGEGRMIYSNLQLPES